MSSYFIIIFTFSIERSRQFVWMNSRAREMKLYAQLAHLSLEVQLLTSLLEHSSRPEISRIFSLFLFFQTSDLKCIWKNTEPKWKSNIGNIVHSRHSLKITLKKTDHTGILLNYMAPECALISNHLTESYKLQSSPVAESWSRGRDFLRHKQSQE